MADTGTATVNPAQDQDFLNAPVHEKHAYLMDTDPEYAKAPPHEQLQYMSDLHQTQFSERGAAQQPPIARPTGGEADIERSWQKTEGLREQRERVGQRAMRAPAPVTAASTVIMPLASEMKAGKLLSAVRKTGGRLAGGAVGAGTGGYAGRRVGGMIGMPDLGETVGSTIGGIGGWVLGGGKGELTEEQTLAKAVREKKANYLPTRIKPPKVEEPSPFAGLTSSAETGKPEVKVDSSGLGETSGQKAKLVTKMQAAKDEAAAGAGTGRRVILAGEGIDPMRTESAGSAAQATEADLRRLASAGDASARQELVRRRLQRGVTDYKNIPLPKGNLGTSPDIGASESGVNISLSPHPGPVDETNFNRNIYIDGKRVGTIDLRKSGGSLHVDSLEGSFGPKGIRALTDQLWREYPDVDSIKYERMRAPESGPPITSNIKAKSVDRPLREGMRTSGALPERRSAPREVQGPDLMRTARAQELRTALQDPSLSARDRRIMQDQLDDIKNNPFERHEGGDIKSMKAKKPTMSRAEAEAGTEARKAGRKARFGGPPVPEEGIDSGVSKLKARGARIKNQQPIMDQSWDKFSKFQRENPSISAGDEAINAAHEAGVLTDEEHRAWLSEWNRRQSSRNPTTGADEFRKFFGGGGRVKGK